GVGHLRHRVQPPPERLPVERLGTFHVVGRDLEVHHLTCHVAAPPATRRPTRPSYGRRRSRHAASAESPAGGMPDRLAGQGPRPTATRRPAPRRRGRGRHRRSGDGRPRQGLRPTPPYASTCAGPVVSASGRHRGQVTTRGATTSGPSSGPAPPQRTVRIALRTRTR